MNLVIVESPAKATTIQKYLGKGFSVKSSYGHVRDLPKSKMGVDTEHDFEPTYIIPAKSRPRIAELKKALKKAEALYLATDEDREGEAIAWHLMQALKPKKLKVNRITFGEITKAAIQTAIANPRDIDQSLVDAQQARRVLDRLVGYELSPLLWKKVRRGLSAGRVQSVAVRLIADREKKIQAFQPKEYWTLDARLTQHDGQEFVAYLRARDGVTIPKYGIDSRDAIENIIAMLNGATYTVTLVTTKDDHRNPPPPFTTSTLQQAGVNQLGFSSKKTMLLAQQLYEGINLGEQGPTGLITYMRTDSVHLAAESVHAAQRVITNIFGSEYSLESPRLFKTKSKGAQEAHEAIRPTDPSLTPEEAAPYLESDQLKLYRIIWQRMIASQMSQARLQRTTIDIGASNVAFRARGTTVLFDGFAKALGEKAAFQETLLPPVATGEVLTLIRLEHEKHTTQPPARYSEATLVRALEEAGVGRPSTYAPTIDTIQKRGYVEKNSERRFAPTEIGTLVNDLLTDHFPNIVDLEFTATMERDLDQIAAGKKEWRPVINEFYGPFHKLIEMKEKELSKAALTQTPTGESCPACGHELVIKLGRFGKFKACSNFPECKHTESMGEEKKLQDEIANEKCPECGKTLTVRRGRYGLFLGCSGYPDCKHIKRIEKNTGVTCPKCQAGAIVERTSKRGRPFYGCNSYPACKNAYWSKPTGQACPTCGSMTVYGAKNTIRCSNKNCDYTTTYTPNTSSST